MHNNSTSKNSRNPLPPFRDDLLKAQKMWARAQKYNRALHILFRASIFLAVMSWILSWGIRAQYNLEYPVPIPWIFAGLAIYAVVHAWVIRRNARKKVREATRARD